MRKVIDYKTIYTQNSSAKGQELFDSTVREHLNGGWELHGYPFQYYEGYCCQALIKYGEDTSNPTTTERKIEPEL